MWMETEHGGGKLPLHTYFSDSLLFPSQQHSRILHFSPVQPVPAHVVTSMKAVLQVNYIHGDKAGDVTLKFGTTKEQVQERLVILINTLLLL